MHAPIATARVSLATSRTTSQALVTIYHAFYNGPYSTNRGIVPARPIIYNVLACVTEKLITKYVKTFNDSDDPTQIVIR